jgi:hypothetical protein
MIPSQRAEARVLAGQPCGRRTTWLLIVPNCEACGNLHAFRVRSLAALFDNPVQRRCPVSYARLSLAVTP